MSQKKILKIQLLVPIILFILFLQCSDQEFIDFANNSGDSLRIPLNTHINPTYALPAGNQSFYADEYHEQLDERVQSILNQYPDRANDSLFRLIYDGDSVYYDIPFVPGLDVGYTLNDGVNIDFRSLDNILTNVDSLVFIYKFINKTPLNIEFDMIMVIDNQTTENFFDETIILSPATAVSHDNYVASYTEGKKPFDKNKIAKLGHTTSILYYAHISPGWPENFSRVFLDTENYLLFQLAMEIEVNGKISELISGND